MANTKKEVRTEIKNNELVEKKRLQIAKGASKLFIKKGYHETSIREISKITGLTIGNLYDYITKKEDVLYLVFDVFHTIWVNSLEEWRILQIEDPILQLKVATEKMTELGHTYRDMVLLMYTESKLLPRHFLKIIMENESKLIKCFEEILRKGVEKGVFKIEDPFFTANVIVYLLALEPLRGWNLRSNYKDGEIREYTNNIILNRLVCPINVASNK